MINPWYNGALISFLRNAGNQKVAFMIKYPFWILCLTLLLSFLVAQGPTQSQLALGWLGDRLFLSVEAGPGATATAQGAFYADDLTPDSPTQRSRWTRQRALLRFPLPKRSAPLKITLLAQGWPTDALAQPGQGVVGKQPRVTVRANGQIIYTFTPTPKWTEYSFFVPERLTAQQVFFNLNLANELHSIFAFIIFGSRKAASILTLEIETSATFTNTLRGPDPRPKGLRLAQIQLESPKSPFIVAAFTPDKRWDLPNKSFVSTNKRWDFPNERMVFFLAVNALCLYFLLLKVNFAPWIAFRFTCGVLSAAIYGFLKASFWMNSLLTASLFGFTLIFLFKSRSINRLGRELWRRFMSGYKLNSALTFTALVELLAISQKLNFTTWRTFFSQFGKTTWQFPLAPYLAEVYLIVATIGAFLLLLIVTGKEGLPQAIASTMRLFERSRFLLLVLIALWGLGWVGYEASVILALPYVGHADYADNAVVARNLVLGRGWVVDYVTQFYRLYPTCTRPQETWPLLQPVWIAPFLAHFGPTTWATKLPNLLFNILLLLLIFAMGTKFANRRVGATAAILTLTHYLFFNLTIYPTSDLAFVVFALGAVFFLYQASAAKGEPRFRRLTIPLAYLSAGLLTGLLMLQKPSGALLAVGMGSWLLRELICPPKPILPRTWKTILTPCLIFLVWALPALLLLSPYLLYNWHFFGQPVYSTEQKDAWVLGYRGDDEESWNDIYKIYAPELKGEGLPERSWLLRWGFDRTLAKGERQFSAARDYLMPPQASLPAGLVDQPALATFFSKSAGKNLFTSLGAWLALLGFLGLFYTRRSLFALLCFTFAPYLLFLCTYWHANEERYFVVLLPWLALLIAWVSWKIFDRLAEVGWSPLALLLVGLIFWQIGQPSWLLIETKLAQEPPKWQPDLQAYEWLRTHTSPTEVVMARNPWQLQWHAQRPAIMIPQTRDREALLALGEHYHARYLILENLQRLKGDAAQNLASLRNAKYAQVGAVIDGFVLVYRSPSLDNLVMIYQFPSPNPF